MSKKQNYNLSSKNLEQNFILFRKKKLPVYVLLDVLNLP